MTTMESELDRTPRDLLALTSPQALEKSRLVYAQPFFMKLDGTEKFFYSGVNNSCMIGTALDRTSLVTFHGRNGSQKNRKGDKELVCVKDSDIVTVFANIPHGGRYLKPNSFREVHKHYSMVWTGSTADVKSPNKNSFKEEYEFVIRIVESKKEPFRNRLLSMKQQNGSRSSGNSFTDAFNKILSYGTGKKGKMKKYNTARSGGVTKTDTSALKLKVEGSSNISLNVAGTRVSQAHQSQLCEVETVTVSDMESDADFSDDDLVTKANRRSKSKTRKNKSLFAANIHGTRTLRSKQNPKKLENVRLSTKASTANGKKNSVTSLQNFRRHTHFNINSNPHDSLISVNLQQPSIKKVHLSNSKRANSVQLKQLDFYEAEANISEQDINVVNIGDLVVLESKLKPGYFLSVSATTNSVQLSRHKGSKFEIVAPELRHLVELNATKIASASQISPSGNVEVDAEDRMITVLSQDETEEVKNLSLAISKSEETWHGLLNQLPLEIVWEIVRFLPRWLPLARLVCKSWMVQTDKYVTRIRLNGIFENVFSLQDRHNLFRLINRCSNITEVLVRNVDELIDNDFRFLNGKNRLSKLEYIAFGGCTGLGDGCIKYICKVQSVKKVNLAVTKVTDRGLIELAKKLPTLEYLNLYGCKFVTPRGIIHLLVHLKDLKEINIRGTGVTSVPQRFLRANEVDGSLQASGVKVLMGNAEGETIYG